VIEDESFGTRFLGGEDFCVFKSQDAARAEIDLLVVNSRVIDTWEIHVLRHDLLWETVAAGLMCKPVPPVLSEPCLGCHMAERTTARYCEDCIAKGE
jgi:hypothetical protein